MLGLIAKWARRRRENTRLADIARKALAAKYPDRSLLGWRSPIQQLPNGDCLVTVWWSNGMRPCHRSWWRIDTESGDACELTYDQAEKLIKIFPLR
jgi:hypothetical protein